MRPTLERSSGDFGRAQAGIDLAERQESFEQHCDARLVRPQALSSRASEGWRNGGRKPHEGSRRADRRHHRRRHGHGARARPPAGRRGLQRRHVRRVGGGDGRDQAAVRGRRACRRACASPPTSPTSPTKTTSSASATRWPSEHDTDKHPPAVQQRRHRRRRQHDRPRARGMGAHLQHLLVRRLLLHPRLPADDAEGRPRPHRQHRRASTASGPRSAPPCRTPPTAPPSSR